MGQGSLTWRTKEEGKHSTGMTTVLRARGECQGMRLAAPREGGWACVRACAHTHTHARARLEGGPTSWSTACSKAHCEPNLEPDPAPRPPASQPARDVPEINDARESGQGLVPNGAHPLQTPLQLRTGSALRAPACRNTPRLFGTWLL